MQKAVGVFTGFRQKGFGAAHPDISADGRKDASHGNGGIRIRGQKNGGYHGGGGCFAVCSGYGNGGIVVCHNLPQQFGSGEHGKASLLRSGKLRIVRVNGGRVNNQPAVGRNIGCLLSDKNPGAQRRKMLRQL